MNIEQKRENESITILPFSFWSWNIIEGRERNEVEIPWKSVGGVWCLLGESFDMWRGGKSMWIQKHYSKVWKCFFSYKWSNKQYLSKSITIYIYIHCIYMHFAFALSCPLVLYHLKSTHRALKALSHFSTLISSLFPTCSLLHALFIGHF